MMQKRAFAQGYFGPDQVRGFVRFIVTPAQVRKFGFVHLYANFRNPDVDIVQTVCRAKKQTADVIHQAGL